MYTPFYPFHLLVFEPSALDVHGQHYSESLPVHPRLNNVFQKRLPDIRERILATPGGFDGNCAALLHWEHEAATGHRPAQLRIATGYRSYSQGHTLKTVMLAQGVNTEPNPLLPTELSPRMQPIPGLSWGSSLTTLVLLPENRVLTGQRGPNMQTNPSFWACLFTEALEPTDINVGSMDNLLARLAKEELADLSALGPNRFVGLALLPESYTWTLVSVLDLRAAPRALLAASLGTLRPDAETQAWGQHLLPGLTQTPLEDTKELLGLALAQDIASRLPRPVP